MKYFKKQSDLSSYKMAPAKPPKVKTLTGRRRWIMMCFIKKSQMYPELYGEIGTKHWKDMLIDFLCDPKHCRANARDIDAWLKLPDVVEEIAEQAEEIAENPPLPPPPRAEWPWPDFLAAIGLTRLPILKTEKKAEPTPQRGYTGHGSGRKLRKRRVDTEKKVVNSPEVAIARPIDQRNCNIM